MITCISGSTRRMHQMALSWSKEDLYSHIRQQYPLLQESTFKLYKVEKRRLELIPENIHTPADIKQWGELKCSALYIVPDSELVIRAVPNVESVSILGFPVGL